MKKLLLFAISLISISMSAQNLIWAKKFGGSSDEYVKSVAVDATGNVYTSGYFKGTTDFNPGTGTFTLTSAGNYDIFVSKLDAAGNFIWAKKMGGTQDDMVFEMAIDATGNVYTTGSFNVSADFDPGVGSFSLTSSGSRDVFISKLDAAGNFVWAKQIGAIADDLGYNIAVDGSGNVYTCGYFIGAVDFDPGAASFSLTAIGSNDIFISKLDAAGNFVWAKNMGSTVGDVATCLTLDASGNIYTSGYFQGTADFDPGVGTYTLVATAMQDVFVSKLDAAGNFVWARKMGGGGADVANDIAVDASGNVLTSGYFQNAVDFDPGAGTFTIAVAGADDAFISKLDASGNFVWAKSLGGSGYEGCYGITTNVTGDIYTTGYFQGSADFDPSAGSFSLTAVTGPGSNDIFVSKLDASGNFVWAKGLGGGSNDISYDIECDATGDIYIPGGFATTADFDPNAGVFNLITSGLVDGYVVKLGALGTSINETNGNITAVVYPNPTNSTLNIKTEETIESVTVYNLLGAVVLEEKNNSFSVEQLPAGVYTLQIKTANGIGTVRFVKE
ncbi:MAG: SBBP repeat-containing protein [Bacteroidia bacterium]|nr:SBBP repeat-containing protein [Bacteroidia bacterium]